MQSCSTWINCIWVVTPLSPQARMLIKQNIWREGKHTVYLNRRDAPLIQSAGCFRRWTSLKFRMRVSQCAKIWSSWNWWAANPSFHWSERRNPGKAKTADVGRVKMLQGQEVQVNLPYMLLHLHYYTYTHRYHQRRASVLNDLMTVY